MSKEKNSPAISNVVHSNAAVTPSVVNTGKRNRNVLPCANTCHDTKPIECKSDIMKTRVKVKQSKVPLDKKPSNSLPVKTEPGRSPPRLRVKTESLDIPTNVSIKTEPPDSVGGLEVGGVKTEPSDGPPPEISSAFRIKIEPPDSIASTGENPESTDVPSGVKIKTEAQTNSVTIELPVYPSEIRIKTEPSGPPPSGATSLPHVTQSPSGASNFEHSTTSPGIRIKTEPLEDPSYGATNVRPGTLSSVPELSTTTTSNTEYSPRQTTGPSNILSGVGERETENSRPHQSNSSTTFQVSKASSTFNFFGRRIRAKSPTENNRMQEQFGQDSDSMKDFIVEDEDNVQLQTSNSSDSDDEEELNVSICHNRKFIASDSESDSQSESSDDTVQGQGHGKGRRKPSKRVKLMEEKRRMFKSKFDKLRVKSK